MSKSKKIVSLALLALGLLMVLVGVILICQMGASHTGGNGGLSRASTSIRFNADFYTTSAQATGLAANSVIDIYKLLSFVSGMFFIFVGGMDICLTLLKFDIEDELRQHLPSRKEAPKPEDAVQPPSL